MVNIQIAVSFVRGRIESGFTVLLLTPHEKKGVYNFETFVCLWHRSLLTDN